jgi:hypothetical protein
MKHDDVSDVLTQNGSSLAIIDIQAANQINRVNRGKFSVCVRVPLNMM